MESEVIVAPLWKAVSGAVLMVAIVGADLVDPGHKVLDVGQYMIACLYTII